MSNDDDAVQKTAKLFRDLAAEKHIEMRLYDQAAINRSLAIGPRLISLYRPRRNPDEISYLIIKKRGVHHD